MMSKLYGRQQIICCIQNMYMFVDDQKLKFEQCENKRQQI